MRTRIDRTGGRRWVNRLAALILAGVAAGGGYYYFVGGAGGQASRVARGGARAPVPVTVAVAARRSLPIYLTGLGTVQPTLNVGIHSQVDGKLQEGRFTYPQPAH